MGMYTGIRFRGYVKPEYRREFEAIALNGKWWESSIPECRAFGRNARAVFIPMGAITYMPDYWYEEDIYNLRYDVETGYWAFKCSLKNYNYEIEQFLSIIPVFIEEISYMEVHYEEMGDEETEYYMLIDGRAKRIELEKKEVK